MPRRILVIEDNRDLARLLQMHLGDLSFEVDLAFDGVTGLSQAEANHYDLIVLDLMLPGLDGLEICRKIRGRDVYTPIVMLTSKTSELDRVLGLELGADDYVTKPFSIRELLARVKAIFRRMDEFGAASGATRPEPLRVREMCIDPEKRDVRLGGTRIDLTAKEFDLLYHFARNPGKVFTRSQLLDTVWGYGHAGYEHTVNSHINRLRRKIEENPSEPRYILTVWGVGYKFADFQE